MTQLPHAPAVTTEPEATIIAVTSALSAMRKILDGEFPVASAETSGAQHAADRTALRAALAPALLRELTECHYQGLVLSGRLAGQDSGT